MFSTILALFFLLKIISFSNYFALKYRFYLTFYSCTKTYELCHDMNKFMLSLKKKM